MLNDKIDALIAEAMKNGDTVRLGVLRLIKNEFLKYKTEKHSNILNDTSEAIILNKMLVQREDSINQYLAANRQDLADNEKAEITVILEYAPKQASDEEIKHATIDSIGIYLAKQSEGFKLSMKDMKIILSMVQDKYPTANGKIVSSIMNVWIKTNGC